jgi:hypothetical protein
MLGSGQAPLHAVELHASEAQRAFVGGSAEKLFTLHITKVTMD